MCGTQYDQNAALLLIKYSVIISFIIFTASMKNVWEVISSHLTIHIYRQAMKNACITAVARNDDAS